MQQSGVILGGLGGGGPFWRVLRKKFSVRGLRSLGKLRMVEVGTGYHKLVCYLIIAYAATFPSLNLHYPTPRSEHSQPILL
jgi:hypothetical protein